MSVATSTTDAPYRETTIARAESLGIVAVEMEAAALYAFPTAQGFDVICVAHVTNTMATEGDGFEKGEADGAHDALEVVAAIIERLRGDQVNAVSGHAALPISTPEGDSRAPTSRGPHRLHGNTTAEARLAAPHVTDSQCDRPHIVK